MRDIARISQQIQKMITEERQRKLDILETTLFLLSEKDPDEAELIQAINKYLEPHRIQHATRSEQTKAGLVVARMRGRRLGRKPKFSDSEATAMCEMYDTHTKTVEEIAEIYGTSRRTVYDYLKRRNETRSAGHHPNLIKNTENDRGAEETETRYSRTDTSAP